MGREPFHFSCVPGEGHLPVIARTTGRQDKVINNGDFYVKTDLG